MKKLYNAEAICNITLKEESPSNLAIWTNKRYRYGFWLNLKEYEVPDYAWCFRPQEIGEMENEVIGDDEDLIRQCHDIKIYRKPGKEPELWSKASVTIKFINGETKIKFFNSNYEAKEEFERVSALIPKPFEFD